LLTVKDTEVLWVSKGRKGLKLSVPAAPWVVKVMSKTESKVVASTDEASLELTFCSRFARLTVCRHRLGLYLAAPDQSLNSYTTGITRPKAFTTSAPSLDLRVAEKFAGPCSQERPASEGSLVAFLSTTIWKLGKPNVE
jgi:hypothetical protein